MRKTRRDALKILGAGALLASGVGVAQQAQAKTSALSPKIAIIGAGLGGITLSASLIKAMPNAKITLFDKDEDFYYQPGFTLIAAGIYNLSDVAYKKSELINEKVEWKKEHIAQILPESNQIISQNGKSYEYDILVIATGVEYDFNAVEGLSEADLEGESSNIATIYTPKSALKAQNLFRQIIAQGKEGKNSMSFLVSKKAKTNAVAQIRKSTFCLMIC